MSDPQAPAYRRRVIIATSIGNALEWFDFVVYGFLAVTMARLFFPAPTASRRCSWFSPRSAFRSWRGRSAPS